MSTLWQTMLQTISQEYSRSPKSFLRQKTISKTVHPNCAELARLYYNEMKNDSFCVEHILPNLSDSKIGNPHMFPPLPNCSPISVTHSYQLHLLKQYTGLFIPQDKISYIVEIGGGYGHTCRMIMNYGYTGRYTIVDFPQMLGIQEDFLTQNNIDNVEYHPLDMERIQPKQNEVSLLYASFSINEMPMDQREHMESYYDQYDYIFIAHNRAFDGVDNVQYFDQLKAKLSSTFDVQHFTDPHRGQRAWFMICSKKENNNVR